jgi:hypothetical protein
VAAVGVSDAAAAAVGDAASVAEAGGS